MISSHSGNMRRVFGLLLVVALFVGACNSGGGGSGSQATAVPSDAVVVTFTYGSEKEAWIKAVTASFQATNPKTAAGKPIVVQAAPAGSGESMDDIIEGRTQPSFWSPASRIWLPIINDEWARKNGKDIVTETECRDLVLSPVVIMMWKPMAEALGWPNTEIGWADLAKLATNPQGWAAYNKPQWGRFRLGHTHPDFSNSGLQTIVAMAYAANPGIRRLTVDEVNKTETVDFIHDIQSGIAHYGRSTGFFGTAMAQRGTSYLSAAVVYESVVIQNNTDPKVSRILEFPLVAVYPKDGTFQSDHPACILDAPWVSADQKEAAGLYRTYLLGKEAQQRALQFGFRPSDVSIPISEPITLANGADPAQPKNTLAVPNAATIRAVRQVWEQQKRQVNLTLLIDVSGSMKDNDKMVGAREGAAAFVDQLADNDVLTLVAFSTSQAVVFENLLIGPNRDAIKRDISQLTPQGGTALYDSIAFSIDRMKLDPTRINALVVLTDGEDRDSKRFPSGDPNSVTRLMQQYGQQAERDNDVAIFTIGYGAEASQDALTQIANQGRGAFRSGSTADIRQVYLDISTFF